MARASDFSSDEVTYLDYEQMVKATDLAKCFRLEDDGEEHWIPKSLIQLDKDNIVGVPTWWAKKNGLY